MLRYIKWAFWIVVVTVVAAFLHYTLPQRDIVRVVSTEIVPNFQTNWPIFFAQHDEGTVAQETRPLRLIQTVRKRTWFFGMIDRGEQTMVYRNEDTGWIWPPYFKFDSSDLQTEAEDLRSTSAEPRWAVMTHYGWRIIYMTVYPNALRLTPIDDPNARLIPWFNIIFLTFLLAVFWGIRVRWVRFRDRRIKPLIAGVDAAVDQKTAGVSRWFSSWRR